LVAVSVVLGLIVLSGALELVVTRGASGLTGLSGTLGLFATGYAFEPPQFFVAALVNSMTSAVTVTVGIENRIRNRLDLS
jgi:hypothetical protein